jgi:hypothetical protein
MAANDKIFDAFAEAFPQHVDFMRKAGAAYAKDSEIKELARAPQFGSNVVWHTKSLPAAQYGLLGFEKRPSSDTSNSSSAADSSLSLVYSNTNEPWSAFICGSQGSGKSHTLASVLENCILPDLPAGNNSKPLAAIAFHYDQFTSFSSTKFCELAYLASAGIKVRVVASPSNFETMKKLYTNLPGLAAENQPEVVPFKLRQRHLNIDNMMTLMNVKENDSTPLYMAVIWKILRSMAAARPDRPGISYPTFREAIAAQNFIKGQTAMLDMRLNLLESLLDKDEQQKGTSSIWSCEAGSLTIVDLSSPFLSAGDACALFNVSLNLFMAKRGDAGRVVVLDEAHKVTASSLNEYQHATNHESVLDSHW